MNICSLAKRYITASLSSSLLQILTFAAGISILLIILNVNDLMRDNLSQGKNRADVIVGAKGSPLQLVLSGVYHADIPTGNIYYNDAMRLLRHRSVKDAVPISLGDSYKSFRIVGTKENYLDFYGLKLKEGDVWDKSMEAVVGHKVADALSLRIGDSFTGSHGLVAGGAEHGDSPYKVVGILEKSKTVNDRLIFTDLRSVWDVHGSHDHGNDSREDDEHSHDNEDSGESDDHEHDHDKDDIHEHDEDDLDEENNHESHSHDENAHDDEDSDEGHNHDHSDHAHHEEGDEEHEEHEEDKHDSHKGHDDHVNSNHDSDESDEDHEHHDEHAYEGHDGHGYESENNDHNKNHVVTSKISDIPSDSDLEVTALLIKYKNRAAAINFPRMINKNTNMQAASPSFEMAKLFNVVGVGFDVVKIIGYILIAISIFSIFLMLFSNIKKRYYDIAILRVFGASPAKIMKLVIYEGMILSVAGIIAGFVISRAILLVINNIIGEISTFSVNIASLTIDEIIVIAILIIVSFIASVIPALMAYKVDIRDLLKRG